MKTITRLLIVVLTLLTSGMLVAQGSWESKASFGGGLRYAAVAVSTGDTAYVGLGIQPGSGLGGYMTDFWAYDATSDSWSQKADFPGGVRASATGFAINGIVYVGTGSHTPGDVDWVWYNDLWAFDPVDNTWTEKAGFGERGRHAAVGFSINGKGYIGTGTYRRIRWESASYYNDFWEYDPVADAWERQVDIPTVGRTSAVGLSIAGKGYVGLGLFYYDSRQKDWWEFNPQDGTWAKKAALPGLPRAQAAGFTLGNRGYVGGGGYYSVLRDFYEYNPEDDSWTRQQDYPIGIYGPAGFSIGCKGYFVTGQTATSEVSSMYQFTPAPPITVNIPDVWAVNPGGRINNLYIGYGPSEVTLTANVTGGIGSYEYFWNTGATTQEIEAGSSTPGEVTYTVTATDEMGCTGSGSKTIQVVDVRCGPDLSKVAVCKAPPDNPENVHMICLPAVAVAGQLMDGSMLGECSGTVAYDVEVFPNPSDGLINIRLEGLSAAVQIRISDRNGRMILQRTVHPEWETLTETFDLSDVPPGLYIVNIKNRGNVVVSKIFVR